MVKRRLCIVLTLCLICLLAASCALREIEQPKPFQKTQSPVDAIIEQNDKPSENPDPPNTSSSPKEDEKPYESAPQIVNEADNSETVKTDVDLTALSSTMVYAEVYNIMMNPDSYVGKTIKGNGAYNSFYYEEMDMYFHYFIITDATGCCPQGLDFVRNGEYTYPDDYPRLGEDIEVMGVFVKGEIEGQPYYYLAVDDISVLK